MSSLYLTSFGNIMGQVFYVLIALLVLMVMITVHEFGHYVAGKIFGFGIEEFAIGFGPKIYRKKRKNGEYFSIRLLPFGGFCAFKGEDEESSSPDSFNNKKAWQRIIVLLSGAFMNYLLALLIICCMFSFYGKTTIMTYKIKQNTQISTENQFEDRDIILYANGKNVFMLTDLITAIENKDEGDTIPFVIMRHGERKNINITLQNNTYFSSLEDVSRLVSALGMEYSVDEHGGIIDSGLRSTGIKVGFFETIGASFLYSFKIGASIFITIKQLITGAIGLSSLGGTVTTIVVTANVVKTGGLWSLLNISSFIGVNLALFNLLPIPALDGSRAVFTLFEWIFKKPVNRRVEGIVHTVGFVLLLIFAIVIDLQRCF